MTRNKIVKMHKNVPRILVYGYGNPGRQDDALGVLLSEEIAVWAEKENIEEIDTDQNYQLNIEDADKIAQYDIVVFADASVNDIDSYQLDEVVPDTKTDFSMHSVTPSFVTGLCRAVFKNKPKVFQLQVKGYEWEFMENPTKKASENLSSALNFLKSFIMKQLKQ